VIHAGEAKVEISFTEAPPRRIALISMPVLKVSFRFSGAGADADLIEALYYAVDHNADVISMSLGFTGTGAPDGNGDVCTEVVGLNAALDYAYQHGVVVVAAAGNDGTGTVTCPAAYPTVILPYHKATWMEVFQYPHNIVFNLWSETGLLGLFAFAWILYTWVRGPWSVVRGTTTPDTRRTAVLILPILP